MNKHLIALPEEGWTNMQKWLHYKRAENLAKQKQKELQEDATSEIRQNNDVLVQEDGKMQYIESSTRRPKESIQSFLRDKGYLDLCKKDEIDLKKVQDLVDAGVLEQNEVDDHIDIKPKSYLTFKKKK